MARAFWLMLTPITYGGSLYYTPHGYLLAHVDEVERGLGR